MILLQIPVGPMLNFSYIIGDEETGLSAVVDPAWDVDKILGEAERGGLKVIYIINTHTHFDHIQGNGLLASKTGAKVVMHERAKEHKDVSVKDGDMVRVGRLEVKVLHTPGHSPDAICLMVGRKLLTGDTIFVGSCGRVDLPGGSAEELHDSFFGKLLKLEDDIEIYPGHDYGERPSSTIGFERRHNYALRPRTKEEFMGIMMQGQG